MKERKMKNKKIFEASMFIALILTPIKITSAEKAPQPYKVMRNFLDAKGIGVLRGAMDAIKKENLENPDYEKRPELLWSDVVVKISKEKDGTDALYAKIVEEVEEFDTTKAKPLDGSLQQHKTPSLMSYPLIQSIICDDVFPRMLNAVESWEKKKLPKKFFSQICLQRGNTSEGRDWHQDPSEGCSQQADYALFILLSREDHPTEGWNGGEFKIRPSLPHNKHTESEVTTIMPCCNQGILFNNQANSHPITPVTCTTGISKRDLLIITLNRTKMPTLLE
jgi:hypothetical protein